MAAWLAPLISLIATLVGIVGKAIADKNATHDQVQAEVDAALLAYRGALADLDTAAKAAQGKTDQAIEDAEARLGAGATTPSTTLPTDEGP